MSFETEVLRLLGEIQAGIDRCEKALNRPIDIMIDPRVDITPRAKPLTAEDLARMAEAPDVQNAAGPPTRWG